MLSVVFCPIVVFTTIARLYVRRHNLLRADDACVLAGVGLMAVQQLAAWSLGYAPVGTRELFRAYVHTKILKICYGNSDEILRVILLYIRLFDVRPNLVRL